MINCKDRMTKSIKLNYKLQCLGQVVVIVAMQTYLLKEPTNTEVVNTQRLKVQQAANNANKKVILKSCAPFIKCIQRINNMQIYNSHDIDVVMPMHSLIEYSDNYSKTSKNIWNFMAIL